MKCNVNEYNSIFVTIPNIKEEISNLDHIIYPPLRIRDKIPFNSILIYIHPIELFFFIIQNLQESNLFIYSKIIKNNILDLDFIKKNKIFPLCHPFVRMLDSRSNINNAFKNINKFEYVKYIAIKDLKQYGVKNTFDISNFKSIKYDVDKLTHFLADDYKLFDYLSKMRYKNFSFKNTYLDGIIECISSERVSGIVKFFDLNNKHTPQFVNIIKNGEKISTVSADLIRNIKHKRETYTIKVGFDFVFEEKLTDDDIIEVIVQDSSYSLRYKKQGQLRFC
jgi:hypothetical protein